MNRGDHIHHRPNPPHTFLFIIHIHTPSPCIRVVRNISPAPLPRCTTTISLPWTVARSKLTRVHRVWCAETRARTACVSQKVKTSESRRTRPRSVAMKEGHAMNADYCKGLSGKDIRTSRPPSLPLPPSPRHNFSKVVPIFPGLFCEFFC